MVWHFIKAFVIPENVWNGEFAAVSMLNVLGLVETSRMGVFVFQYAVYELLCLTLIHVFWVCSTFVWQPGKPLNPAECVSGMKIVRRSLSAAFVRSLLLKIKPG